TSGRAADSPVKSRPTRALRPAQLADRLAGRLDARRRRPRRRRLTLADQRWTAFLDSDWARAMAPAMLPESQVKWAAERLADYTPTTPRSSRQRSAASVA